MSKRLRKGDMVIVITGADKGKTGKILTCDKNKVVVEGVNIRKKHMKKREQNQRSQIIDMETPINISNVRFCVDGKPCKLKARINDSNEKELYYLDGSKEVLYRSVKKSPVKQ